MVAVKKRTNKTDDMQRFLVSFGQVSGLNKRPQRQPVSGEGECVGQFPTLVQMRQADSAKKTSILWKHWCRPTLTFNFSRHNASIEFHEYIENIEMKSLHGKKDDVILN